MIPELGYFSLVLALTLSIFQCLFPLYGNYLFNKGQSTKAIVFYKITRPLTLGVSFFIVLSFLILSYAFVNNDFSVAYVAQHSNTSLAFMYKISALWAGHEGSLLLWVLLLAVWGSAAALSSRELPLPLMARLFSVMAFINVGFLLFILTVSNPFSRLLPHYPLDGLDLNPLLQDPGLVIHPPILYLGYVGFTVPFAFAIAVLWLGELETVWVNWVRTFILLPWSFLTIGITLGSWWAYYELGWGGWWFWDPVENASLMPWLVATGLVHSLIITRKKKQFSAWTLLLAIIVFALCLLGTFLVRSGLISTVHAFANDPQRGILILQFVTIVISASLVLFAMRAQTLSKPAPLFLFSRESLLVFNSMLLLVLALSILLGTLFPMVYELITGQKISVGFPYFNNLFIFLMIPVLCSIPLGPFTHWGENHPFSVIKQLRISLLLSVVVAIIAPLLLMKQTSLSVILSLNLALWVAFGTLESLRVKISGKGLSGLSLAGWGMVCGHLGIAITAIGIVIVSHYAIELEMKVLPQVPVKISDYDLTLKEITLVEGSNYLARTAHFTLEKNAQTIAELYPEKRLFVVPGTMMTETAIDAGLFRDIYISLGEKLPDGGISARIYYKPFVRWIWFGGIMIAFGAMIAAMHRKEKKPK
jgi:cytochrome c-type biogenesis protein CcmF